MQLVVRTLRHESFKVDVEHTATIGDLKKAIQECKGYAPRCQILLRFGEQLHDQHTVQSCGLEPESCIMLVMLCIECCDRVLVPLDQIQKDTELYFEDGNVKIVTNHSLEFRVYKGMLSKFSEAFKNLFADAQPEMDAMDNCSVLHLQDSATDFRHFLRAIMTPQIDLFTLTSLPFATISSIIRIAHKYQAEYNGVEIVGAVASRLESFFVPGGGHWLDPTKTWEECWEMGQKQCGISLEFRDAIEAVRLARLIHKPNMLPLLFYLCCLGDVLHLRNGVPREDGTLEILSSEDYIRCVTALPILSHHCDAAVRRALDIVYPPFCSNRGHCQSLLSAMHLMYCKDDVPLKMTDMFIRIDRRTPPPKAYTNHARSLCRSCHDCILSRSEAQCREMLKKLPQYFGLQSLGEPLE